MKRFLVLLITIFISCPLFVGGDSADGYLAEIKKLEDPKADGNTWISVSKENRFYFIEWNLNKTYWQASIKKVRNSMDLFYSDPERQYVKIKDLLWYSQYFAHTSHVEAWDKYMGSKMK